MATLASPVLRRQRWPSLATVHAVLLLGLCCASLTLALEESIGSSLPLRDGDDGETSDADEGSTRPVQSSTLFRSQRTLTYFAETVTTGRITISKGSDSALEDAIDLGSLKVVHLLTPADPRQGGAGRATSAACRGPVCPDFGPCESPGLEGISCCWNEELSPKAAEVIPYKCPRPPWDLAEAVVVRSECLKTKPVPVPVSGSASGDANGAPTLAEGTESPEGESPWAGQVVLLQDVFVDRLGRVFNSTHRFHFGGCPTTMSAPLRSTADTPTNYPKGSPLLVYQQLVNFMVEPQQLTDIVYLEIGLKLPLFLSLAKLFMKLQDLPWAIHRRQAGLWHHFLGTRAPLKRLQSVKGASLFFVKKLYQPLLPPCDQPSAAQWQLLRTNHLLHPDGLPIFDGVGRLRHLDPIPALAPLSPQMPLDHTWLVVVAVKHHDPEVEQRMREVAEVAAQLFTRAHVVILSPGRSQMETKDLFNRALLFISPSGPHLADMVFMPYSASIVEVQLEEPGTTEEAALKGRVYERLARAAGLVHYSLPCYGAAPDAADSEQNLGNPKPLCSAEHILSALESVQHEMFKVPRFKTYMVSSDGRGFGSRIPGTRISSPTKRLAFRQWLHCATQRGVWVRDERPRILPWDLQAGLSVCDVQHAEKGGLAGPKADFAVKRGIPPSKWTVREALKYRWEVPEECGTWKPFERYGLFYRGSGSKPLKLGARGLNILFLGDSLAGQLSKSFLNNVQMLMHPIEPPKKSHVEPQEGLQECVDWINGKTVAQTYCRFDRMRHTYLKNITINFIRNDQLLISGNRHNFMGIPFTRMHQLGEADVIIMNKGAHPRSNMHYMERLRSTMRHLRLRFPNTMIIYRSTPTGHPDCDKYKYPTETPSLEFFGKYKKKYRWHTFAAQDALAKKIVEEAGGVFVDVSRMASFRQDGHPGILNPNGQDCLHYCMPGPIDGWVQMLYNILLKAVPRNGTFLPSQA